MSDNCYGWNCNCGSGNCGSICRQNLRDLSIENFDITFAWTDNKVSGTVGNPTIDVSNDGGDMLFRLQWTATGATWQSFNRWPNSRAWIIALDKQSYTISDYGIPWFRRDYWRYAGESNNHWIVNGTDYISQKYGWSSLYVPGSASDGTHYVGSPLCFAVFECNGKIFHCVGSGSVEDVDKTTGSEWLGPGMSYLSNLWIPAYRENPVRHCLVTRRGYDSTIWLPTAGFIPSSVSGIPSQSAPFPGVPFQPITSGAPGLFADAVILPQDLIDYGYRMGFAISWQLGGQPVTPKTTASVSGSVQTTWGSQTIDADVMVRVKNWSADIIESTGSVNCFEPSGDFPAWYQFRLSVDTDVRNAFKAMTDEECPLAHLVYDFPSTEFVGADNINRMNGLSGYISHDPPLATEKHAVTVRVSGTVCESQLLASNNVSSVNTTYLNGATSYDGKFMGIRKIQFREICEGDEVAVGCRIFTLFLISVSGGGTPTYENGPVFYSNALDTSDGAVNVLSLYEENWTAEQEQTGYCYTWANCLTDEQKAGITATLSFHSSAPGTS